MAIVKAKYVKRGRGEKARAKATMRYIQHRPGKQGKRTARTLFGSDGGLERYQAYRMIDEATPGTIFFRIIISPDPRLEDTEKDLHLWELTAKTMEVFEQKLKNDKRLQGGLPWVAVEHNDHSAHRHVHALLLFPGKLRREDIALLRQTVTELALSQRRERDLAHGYQLQEEQGRGSGMPFPAVTPGATPWEPQAKPLEYLTCLSCGAVQVISRGGAYRCGTCGARLSRGDRSPGLQEVPWG